MLNLLLPFIFMAGAYFGRPLQTENLQYQELSQAPSCQLLQHRKAERDKVLRERDFLDSILDNESLQKIVFKNQFLANQFFMDQGLWDDDLVEVSFETDVTDDLKTAIDKYSLDKLFFSVRGTGFEWSSFTFNFPEGFEIESINEYRLRVRYLIYHGDYCYLKLQTPEFSWLGPEENTGERFDSFMALENLMN